MSGLVPSPAWERLRSEDAAARLLAQREFRRPLVLEAGAGTGKTTALVARVVAWCLGPGWEKARRELAAADGAGEPAPEAVAARVLDRVAAITFTEAAAAEMGRKVGEALAACQGGGTPRGLSRDDLSLPGGELAARARLLLGHLDRLRVSTIHAFCRRLLAAHPLEAGLHPAFQVDADEEALEEAVRQAVADWLPLAYGEPGDPDALALAAAGIGPGELAEAARALVGAGVPAAALAAEPWAGEGAAGLLDGLREAAAELAELVGDRLSGLAAGRVRGALAALAAARSLARAAGGEGGAGGAGREAVEAAAALLQGESWDKAARKLKEWSKGDLSATEGDRLGPVREEVAAASTRLLARCRHLGCLDLDLFDHARRALSPLVAAAAEALRRRGAVTFQGLLAGARDLLSARPDLRREARGRIDQLLVDEFQDTDRVQCELLAWLALDGPEGERPGLFLVGDPKQSIYAWRSADLAAYDEFVRRVEDAGGERRRLSVNFRSVPAVLAEVERLVAPVMRREVGVQAAFEPLAPAPEREGAAGFSAGGRAPVEHWVSWRRPEEERGGAGTPARAASEMEARAVAADLRRLHDQEGIAWKEAAILVRSGSDLDLYLRALQEAGVPYAAASDRGYYRRREVMDAAALVRAVLDPADHLALATALRAPWVGVPDAALARLWLGGLASLVSGLAAPDPGILSRVEALAARVASEIAPLAPEIPGLGALAGWEVSLLAFVAALARLRASFAREPANLFLERLRGATLLEPTEAARFLGPWRLANLDRFFRHLARALDAPGGGVEAILRLLRRAVAEAREAPEGRPPEAGADAVAVLTLHGAKGLDFAHVYLVQLHKQPQGRPEGRRTAARLVDGSWRLSLLGAPGPGFWQVEEREERERSAEQVRLLYVGATRARERLVLVGKPSPRPVPPERAKCFAELVTGRLPPPPDPEAALGRLAAAGADGERDGDGVLWRYPALSAGEEPSALRSASVPAPAADRAARDSADLAGRMERARARAERPFGARASAEAHGRLAALYGDEGGDDASVPPGRSAGGRAVATAVGEAVHRLLASFDFAADARAELARGRAAALEVLAAEFSGADLEAARGRFEGLLDRFLDGPLGPRFLALGGRVLARELPLLLAPGAEEPEGEGSGRAAPVGYVSGAIDLLYRDPESGELVVADYKTDAVEGEADLAERARAYEGQGALYRRAVGIALGLAAPPRFELWFLAPGQVRAVG